jgi:hypothetical protein
MNITSSNIILLAHAGFGLIFYTMIAEVIHFQWVAILKSA